VQSKANVVMSNPFDTLDARLRNIEGLLLDLKEANVPESVAEQDPLLNVQQAADLLDLTKPTIYSLVSRGSLPVNKRAGRLYFLRSELLAWIQEGRKPTQKDIEREVDDQLQSVKRTKSNSRV